MVGSKFQRGMDTAEVAKRLRADIKAAQRAGSIPAGVKVSVRTSRFSMGSSVSLTVTACPFMVQTREFLRHHATEPHRFYEGQRQTEAARALLAQLQEMGSEYRRDDSDTSTDYFNCNFYLHVDFDGAITSEEHQIAAELWPRWSVADSHSFAAAVH